MLSEAMLWAWQVLHCAKKAGVTHILKAGGAQAVAAMAWGTQSCPKVGVTSQRLMTLVKIAPRHRLLQMGLSFNTVPLNMCR